MVVLQAGVLVHPAEKCFSYLGVTMKASVDFNSILPGLTSQTPLVSLIDLGFSTSVPAAQAYAAYSSSEVKAAKRRTHSCVELLLLRRLY